MHYRFLIHRCRQATACCSQKLPSLATTWLSVLVASLSVKLLEAEVVVINIANSTDCRSHCKQKHVVDLLQLWLCNATQASALLSTVVHLQAASYAIVNCAIASSNACLIWQQQTEARSSGSLANDESFQCSILEIKWYSTTNPHLVPQLAELAPLWHQSVPHTAAQQYTLTQDSAKDTCNGGPALLNEGALDARICP